MILRRHVAVAAFGAGLTAMALVLTGCTGATNASDSSTEDGGSGTGKVGSILSAYTGSTGQFVENYNPLSPTALTNVAGMMYEALFYFNNLAPLDTPAVPVLGDSYEWNEEGTVLTVTTKDGVTWSDGVAFTAKDVAFTFNLIRSTPALNTTGNAPAAEAADDTHVTLTFDKPSFVDGPTILGMTWIVPEHVWKDKQDPATDPNLEPVNTGPMVLDTFTAQSYLFTKNEKFRDADKFEVGGVRFFSLSGNQAGVDKLLAGELDWTSIFIPQVDTVLKAAPDVTYSQYANGMIGITTCSNEELGCVGPQTSAAVRRAIYLAIDRDQVNQLAYFGKGTEISPTLALPKRDAELIASEYAEPAPMSPQLKDAQAELEGDGWTKGADGIYTKGGEPLSLEVLVTAGYTDFIATLEAIKQQVKAAGIDLEIKQVANAENLTAQGLGNFELAIKSLGQGPVGDPYYIYNNYLNSASTGPVGTSINPYGNAARFSNPEVDAALAAAAGTQDLGERATAYATIQSAIVEEVPYIPVLNNASFAEFSTFSYEGWPTYDDQYAPAAPTAPGNGQILVHLRAK